MLQYNSGGSTAPLLPFNEDEPDCDLAVLAPHHQSVLGLRSSLRGRDAVFSSRLQNAIIDDEWSAVCSESNSAHYTPVLLTAIEYVLPVSQPRRSSSFITSAVTSNWIQMFEKGCKYRVVRSEANLQTRDATVSGARKGLRAALAALALDRARADLERAKKSAREGNLRVAYRDAYAGLDQLFKHAQWVEAASQLRDACGKHYPATFGIGVLRFSSDAATHIRGWSDILRALAVSAESQGLDVKRAMRGLLSGYGTQSGSK